MEERVEDKEDDFASKREAELRRGNSIMRRLKNLVILVAGKLNDWSLGAHLRTLVLTGGKA